MHDDKMHNAVSCSTIFKRMQTYNTLSEAVNALTNKGYTADFSIKPYCLHCASLSLELRPEDFQIDEFYRFEGMSDPEDNSVVYAISSVDGKIKGTLVDAYGAYSESLSPAMVERLSFRQE